VNWLNTLFQKELRLWPNIRALNRRLTMNLHIYTLAEIKSLRERCNILFFISITWEFFFCEILFFNLRHNVGFFYFSYVLSTFFLWKYS
jgi:hypothetical protein